MRIFVSTKLKTQSERNLINGISPRSPGNLGKVEILRALKDVSILSNQTEEPNYEISPIESCQNVRFKFHI